ncbi:unnamed protein product, partial [Mesorhabditis belari]|uniref:Ammonium transporter n=1 Tax=Mesorhabditis belari TaxID=2138241 RepID=A0AAF3FUJ8_9BILA
MTDFDQENLLSNLTAELLDLRASFEEYKVDQAENLDAFFLCTMAVIIFLMQCGFAFLEAGAVRSKNTTNILFKNLLDSLFALICYWSIGWALAYGPSHGFVGKFIGEGQFLLINIHRTYTKFFFQYVFAATASTIIAGAVAERCEFLAYVVYCSWISAFVYPILTHWGWDPHGWMAVGATVGNTTISYIDFAGAGVVHLCGGTISLVAAFFIEPRIGRFPIGSPPVEIKGHSVPFAALGGFILMFGFLAFNGGSTGTIMKKGSGLEVSRAMTNTIMSGTTASFSYLILHFIRKRNLSLLLTINACLTGMVSACAACNQMEPWGAIVTGIGSGIIYMILSGLVVRFRIDDPLDAFAVHAGGGSWGLMSATIVSHKGIFYTIIDGFRGRTWRGADFAQVGWQLACLTAIILWSMITTIPIFWGLRRFGKLRVPAIIEIKGLDIYKHGEAAYPLHAYGHGWDEHEPIRSRKVSTVFPTTPRVIGNQMNESEIINEIENERKSSTISAPVLLEQLARESLRSNGGNRKNGNTMIYHNPTVYEHPEFHYLARFKKAVHHPSKAEKENGINERKL